MIIMTDFWEILCFIRRFECKRIKSVVYLIETKCFFGFYLFKIFLLKKWRFLIKKNYFSDEEPRNISEFVV